jgi:DNA-binding IclR family transcriptional regulator
MSQSLERALLLVERIADGEDSLTELAEAIGVHKSTVLRLLQTLESHGYVAHDSEHRYRLGGTLGRLAQIAERELDVRRVVGPHLRELGRRTGHTVHLAAFTDDGVISYIDKVDARQGLRMYSRIGLTVPPHATGVGKVLLGGLPAAERRAVIEGLELARFTDATITDAASLELAAVRAAEQGWAADRGEHEAFMNCVAMPIRGAAGVVAAMSVSVPNVILDVEGVLGLIPELADAAAAASRELGHPGDYRYTAPDPRGAPASAG